jgi:hypothetical protein
VGGSFVIKGYMCDQIKQQEKIDKNKIYNFECLDLLSSNPFIKSFDISIGDSFTISCLSSCASDPVFGSNRYSESSSICASAFHSGAISAQGGKCMLKIIPPQKEYLAEVRNGV